MAVVNAQRSIGTTPTPVTVMETDAVAGAEWRLTNPGLLTIYIGDQSVSTSNGFALAGGKDLPVRTWPGEVLYAVAATPGQSLGVLGTGV